MLVLSRRKSDQIRFPELGITIEVLRIKGKSIQIGIDAPREFQILRGELDDSCDSSPRQVKYPINSSSDHREDDTKGLSGKIQKCIDAANLAIHLAQNQLRQQLSDRAEEALENALDSLEELESCVTRNTETEFQDATVREPGSAYRCESVPQPFASEWNAPTSNSTIEYSAINPDDRDKKGIALAI